MRMILGVVLLTFLVLANAGKLQPISVSVDLKQAQFQVTLPSNPTTGYRWTIQKYDRSYLQLMASQAISAQTKLMGAGGYTRFTFKLVPGKTYPANTTLLFKYERPWEPGKGTLKTIIINLRAVSN